MNKLMSRAALRAAALGVIAALQGASTLTAGAQTYSLWTSATIPQRADSDASAIEVGVKFRADVAGYITGFRFYKFSTNTGVHVGHLWTSAGVLLGTATFSGETASGWQQVSLATPVALAANVTYIASYHTDVGHYAVNGKYFASAGIDSPPLHALSNNAGSGNGVYRDGPSGSFPNQTYQSENYWVDVVFATSLGGDVTPPAVNSITPAAGATGVAITSVVTATFSEMMNASTVDTTTFQLRDSAGTLVAASAWAGGETPTATLTPTSPLANGTTYTVTVKGGAAGVKDLAGNAMASDYTWSFTTAAAPAPPATCPCTIWSAATTPAGADSDANAVEVGVEFRSDVAGYITGFRFYKFATNTGVHVGHLWTSAGVLLSAATFTSETASGWQQVTLATPVAVAANTTYIASYHTDVGHYAVNSQYFAAAGADNPPLHALSDSNGSGNGVYRYGPSPSFPDQTYQSENYWVDVVFTTSLAADLTPPTVNATTPAAGATGVATTSVVTATFSEMMSSSTVNTTTFQLRDSAGTLVPASVWAGGETPTATLTPASPLAYATAYTVTVKGGAGGVKDLAGNALASDYSWSLTTAAPPGPATCPCTIWSTATTPADVDSDPNAIEVGVKFRSDVAGYITGLRFFKYWNNTGTHVGNLWTTTGTRLATATFAGETTSGWQQVAFATPVAIAANTTYIASYHTNAGHYGANTDYFDSGFDNAPLHALRDGLDGPNGVYRYTTTSSFPDQTYHAANYWVDVVFDTTLGPNATPLTIKSITPVDGATGVATTTFVGATFNAILMNPSTVNTTTVQLRDPAGTLVPASVWAGGETPTVTLMPASALANATTYTVTMKGGADGVKDQAGNMLTADYTWSFTTVAAMAVCPCSIWSVSAIPAGADSDANAVEVGVKFRSDVAGYITGFRFYKFSTNTGVHVGHLWTSAGVLLSAATFTGETASGWQQVTLATPVAVAANTTYIASYHTDVGHYGVNSQFFAAAGADNPPLHALSDNGASGNGVYRYGPSPSFPDQTYQSENYWVDVVFTTNVVPLTVQSVAPAGGATDVAITSVVTATFNQMIDSATVNGATFELRDSSGTLILASVWAGGETPTATLTPMSPLAYGTTYTATLRGGVGGVTDLAGNALAADYKWSFTTAAGTALDLARQ